MRQRLNLLENPFVVLGLEPYASKQEVLDASDDAIIDHPEDENELLECRQTLLNPRLRIDAELWTFADAPSARPSLLKQLREHAKINTDVILGLPPLAQINLVGHICTQEAPNAELLNTFVTASAKVQISEIFSIIEGVIVCPRTY